MELIKIENNIAILEPETAEKIYKFETAMKQLKQQEDELKATILKEMEEKQIIKLENSDFMITYIQPSDRESFDNKTFKEEYPDLYDQYLKMTPVKSSIRIKLK